VLIAMGLTEDEAHCTIRFSLGLETKKNDIIYSLDMIAETYKEMKDRIRFVSCR